MRKHLLVIAGIALACFGLAAVISKLSGGSRPQTALAAAPRGATAIAQIDVPALRASPLWRALIEEDGDRGIERVERACGFDPLDLLRSVAVFMVGTEARPFEHLGFVARGDFSREELVSCVQRVVEGDGGAIRRVSIEGVPAIASEHGPSRAAFLGRDGIVGGDELIVREVIRIDHGDAEGAGADPELARLWQKVAVRGQVIAIARLPSNWRAWLTRIAGLEPEILASVHALGVGAQIDRGLGLTIALETAAPDAGAALVEEVRGRIERLLGDPFVGATIAGAALRRIELAARPDGAIATLDLDADQLASLVALARELVAQRRAAMERAAREGAAETLRPDEQIHARDE